MKMNRKQYAVVACVLALMLVLGGCMNAGNRANEQPSEAEQTNMPYVATDPENVTTPAPTTMMPGTAQDAGAYGGNASADVPVEPFNWKDNVAQVQDRINQFSEIAQSWVIVNGNTALVGVEFDPQYRGEMTERIRQMIAGVIMSFDAQVQTVAVTAEDEDVKTIRDLSARMIAGEDEAVRTEMDKIIRNTTTLT